MLSYRAFVTSCASNVIAVATYFINVGTHIIRTTNDLFSKYVVQNKQLNFAYPFYPIKEILLSISLPVLVKFVSFINQ